MSKEENALETVIKGLANAFSDEIVTTFDSVADSPEMKNAQKILKSKDYDSFYYLCVLEIAKPIEGLMIKEGLSDKSIFILENYGFVQNHFEHLIKKLEGHPCCADKSRTIILSLINFFETGKTIEFDLGQEYTFHIPKLIFKDHKTILSHFTAIKGLYYGHYEPYLDSLKSLLTEE